MGKTIDGATIKSVDLTPSEVSMVSLTSLPSGINDETNGKITEAFSAVNMCMSDMYQSMTQLNSYLNETADIFAGVDKSAAKEIENLGIRTPEILKPSKAPAKSNPFSNIFN